MNFFSSAFCYSSFVLFEFYIETEKVFFIVWSMLDHDAQRTARHKSFNDSLFLLKQVSGVSVESSLFHYRNNNLNDSGVYYVLLNECWKRSFWCSRSEESKKDIKRNRFQQKQEKKKWEFAFRETAFECQEILWKNFSSLSFLRRRL